MPTEPFKHLFDPELSKAAAKERIAAAIALIEEIRNYGHALCSMPPVSLSRSPLPIPRNSRCAQYLKLLFHCHSS